MKNKTCFVLIGFGIKTDYPTGRQLNLDNTYISIIKPVLDDLEIKCFRSKDITGSGNIDMYMYEWIYKADLVIADLSTLNPNVLYELGVRHALRPYSTIVISEKELQYPFDLNHTNINPIYTHLGEDIGVQEAGRFKVELKNLIQEILNNPQKDSPVYTFLSDLEMPTFTKKEIRELKKLEQMEDSLTDLLEKAENFKKESKFNESKKLFKSALDINPNNDFIKQRLVLVTYKSKSPTEIEALHEAWYLLEDLRPNETTDPETLGLAGAIKKRLFDKTGEEKYLNDSLKYYEKGFYIKIDYYNGINLAFIYNIRAARIQSTKEEAITDFHIARRVRKHVKQICDDLIKSDNWNDRNDKNWIFLTLAEVNIGLEQDAEEIIKRESKLLEGSFDRDSFNEQKKKLEDVIAEYHKKWNGE